MSISHRQQIPFHTYRRERRAPPFSLSGSAQTLLVTFFCCVFIAGGSYLYSVNRSSVQGYEMRTLEKELKELKKQNVVLRLEAAETSSLARVEAASQELRMEKAAPPTTLSRAPIAFR